MADRNGTPVWFELNTPDPDRAQSFYEAVAGWQFATSPMPEHMGYRMGGPGKEGVAGLMQSQKEQGGFPGWVIYFASDDVDRDAVRVTELGGSVAFGPTDIPHVGRFAMVSDPQGVVFCLMKGDSPDDSQAFKQEPGNFGHGVWIDLATPDPDAALDFYGQLFGWEKQGAMPMGPMGDYTFIGTGEDYRPGAVMSSTTTGAPARWNWYVHVPDIDVAVATVKDEGGSVFQEPMEIPGGEYSTNISDAEGFQLGIVGPRK